MKLCTFDSGNFDQYFLRNGIYVKQYLSTRKTGKHSYHQNNDSNTDYCINIGNGNESNGIILLRRENRPEIIDNHIYNANFFNVDYISDFLIKEKDSKDNRAFILFKNIERITGAKFQCANDYCFVLYPDTQITITDLFQDNYTIINKLKRKTDSPKIDFRDSVFTIY